MSVADRVVRWSTALDVLGVVFVRRRFPRWRDGCWALASWPCARSDATPREVRRPGSGMSIPPLIDELVRLSLCEALAEARQALACPGGDGLEQFLRGLGALFAAHAKYAHLLLERSADGPTAREIRAAVQELTSRALAAGTLNPGVTVGDVMALVWGMRGLTETTSEVAPGTWQRFLDIHLAGLRTPGPVSATPSMSAGQLAELLPRP
jgi:hypothetical protein